MSKLYEEKNKRDFFFSACDTILDEIEKGNWKNNTRKRDFILLYDEYIDDYINNRYPDKKEDVSEKLKKSLEIYLENIL